MNDCGEGTEASYPITVNPLPAAAGVISGTSTVCAGETAVEYSVPAITNATSYTWTYSGTGATITGGTTSNITINFASDATSGILTVRGVNDCGTGTSASYDITITQIPDQPVVSVDHPTCDVSSGTITVTSPTGAGFSYSIDGSVYTNTNGTFTGVSSGNYTVTVRNASGCTSEGVEVVINSQPYKPSKPVAGTVIQPTCGVTTGSIELTGLPSGEWTIYPGGTSGNTTETTLSDLAPGIYSFTVENTDGCVSDASDEITLVAASGCDIEALFSSDNTLICVGGSVVFTNESAGPGPGATYEWSFGEGAVPETATGEGPHTVEYTTAGEKTVRLIVSDVLSDTLEIKDFISVRDLKVHLGSDTILCGQESLVLDPGDYVDYQWSTGENTPTITVYAGTGDISVTVTDANGCQATGEITVDECKPVDLLVIPNTFTPNGDGSHDYWMIRNIEMFPSADIQVFDRWGRLVFHGSSGDQWNGTGPNGKDLPVENYYYIIDLKTGGDDVLTGTIAIVR